MVDRSVNRPLRRRAGVSATLRRTAGNAAFAASAEVIGKIATLAWTLLAARLLDVERFGTFAFVLSAALLLAAVAEWGFDAVMVRQASAHPERLPGLLAQALVMQLAVGVLAFTGVGLLLGGSRGDGAFRLTVALVLTAVLFDIASDTCRGAAASRQRQTATSTALVLQRLVTAALIAAALLAGYGLVGLSAGLLLGSALGLGAHVAALRRLGVRPDLSAVSRVQLADFLRGTWWIGLSILTLMALFRVDALLLAALRGDKEVAAYAAAYRLVETVLFLAFALRAAVFPIMSATEDRGRIAAAMQAGFSALALVYVPYAVVVVFEGDRVLHLLYGAPYDALAAPALAGLALTPLVYGLAFFGSAGLQSVDATRGLLMASTAALSVNVGLNLLLIPEYGATAAGAVTTVSYAVQAGVVMTSLRRSGVRPRLGRPLLEPLAAGAVLTLFLTLPLPLIVEVPVGGIVYLAVWALLVRRTDPRQLAVMRSVLRRSR